MGEKPWFSGVVLALLMTLVLFVVAMGGCQPGPAGEPSEVATVPYLETVKIEFYSEYAGSVPRGEPVPGVEVEGDWGKHVEQLYESMNPNVDIVPIIAVYGGGGSEQLSVRIAAGRYPTVYQAFAGRLFSYSPLFLELPEPPGAQFIQAAVDGCRVNGRLVAYPIEFWEKHSVMNVSLVEQAGCVTPSGTQWTTDQATALQECLWGYDPDLYLFIPPGQKQSGQHDYWGMLAGGARMFMGGDYSHSTWADGGYVARHLEWQKGLLTGPDGALRINPADYDIMEWYNRFTMGRAVMGFKPWVSYLKTNADEGKVDGGMPEIRYMAFPHLEGVAATPVQWGTNSAVAVFAPAVQGNDRLREEAVKFALWLTSPGPTGEQPDYSGPDFARHYYGYQSARTDGYKEDVDPAVLRDFELFGAYDPGMASGAFNEARTYWGEEVTKFWLGETDAQTVVEEFVRRYDEQIARIMQ